MFQHTRFSRLVHLGLMVGLAIPAVCFWAGTASAQTFGWRNAPSWPGDPGKPVANRNSGAALGGVAGGLIGAAIGSDKDKTLEGALIGGLTGAVAGGVLGNQADRVQYENQQIRQYQYRAANVAYGQAVSSAVGFGDVIQMCQSGLPEDVIARQIETVGLVSRPTTSDLIMLKNNGVPDRVLAMMQSAWCPSDGIRQPAVVNRYVSPPTVVVEQWQPAPVYVAPAPVFYYHNHSPGYYRHGYHR